MRQKGKSYVNQQNKKEIIVIKEEISRRDSNINSRKPKKG